MFRFSRLFGCCISMLAVCVVSLQPAHAQTPAAAVVEPINVVHSGINRLYEGLDYVFGLANEPKHLETLKDTLNVFFDGLDTKTPAVIQVYVRKGKFNQVLHAPTLAPPTKFRSTLKALGLKNKTLAPGIFSVNGLFSGFMKEDKGNATQTPVTIIAEDRVDLKPLGLHAAFKLKLDPNNHDLIATIKNDSKLLKERESAIEEVRKQVTPGLKKLKDETEAQFDLRKLTIDQQITEIKQIYAEAALIVVTGDLSKTKKQAVMETELLALPGTPLDTGIAALGKAPSYFANIPLNETEPLSGFINFQLDTMRKEHLQAFLKKARPLIQKEIQDADGATAESKNYAAQATDIMIDVLEQSAKDNLVDGFINVHSNPSKKHTMVGGTKGDGEVVKKGLVKLKQTVPVDLDVEKVGEISFHKVTLPNNMPEWEEIYGKELVLIVGTSTKAIWYAMGENADAKLKEAIAATEKPAATKMTVIASLHGQALIWSKLLDGLRLKTKKGNEESRKTAIAAFEKGGDTFDFKLEMVGKSLKSKISFQEGMLRYFGMVGAKYVKDNLQD